MFNKSLAIKLKPALIFFAIFTVIYWVVAKTLYLTLPFLIGFLIALAIQPIMRFLKKRLKFNSTFASLVSSFLAYTIIFGILVFAILGIVKEILALLPNLTTDEVNEFLEPITALLEKAGSYIQDKDFVSSLIKSNQDKIVSIITSSFGFINTILGSLLKILTSIPAIITMFMVMIFATYFFAKDVPKIKSNFSSFFSKNTMSSISSAWRQGISMMGKYVGSYILIYTLTFLETLIIFLILGVEYPLLLSILTGVADIIPIVGPAIVYIPVAIVYMIQGNFTVALWIIISWLIISLLRQIIEPKIVADSIDIHPLAMLAVVYMTLQTGSLAVMLYMTLLLITYKLLIKVGIIKPLFNTPKKEKKKINLLEIFKNKKGNNKTDSTKIKKDNKKTNSLNI